MPNYLHRTTKIYMTSISPNGLPEDISNYIENPDLSAVQSVPSKYWKITGDVVSEMDQLEKDAVDQAIIDAARNSSVAEQVDDVESVLRQVIKMTISEINILRAFHGLPDRTIEQFKNQIRNDLGT